MDQNPQDQHSGAGELDLNNILLPKKGAPSLDSAQRVDAGTLLNQEQSATLTPAPPPPAPVPVPPATPPEHKPREGVAPLQTLQGDIAGIVKDKGVSVVTIAAAEAERRGTQPVSQDIQLTEPGHPVRTTVFFIVGAVLFLGALGLLGYSMVRNTPLPAQQAGVAPFIAIDGAYTLQIPFVTNGSSFMRELAAAKTRVSLSLGLVAQIYVEQAGATSEEKPVFLDSQALLLLLAPQVSQAFVRTIDPVYLLGIHSFGVNQPFLIFRVESYEQAYAGMLEWEQTIKRDLSPLFTYVPPPNLTLSPNTTVVIQPPSGASSSTMATGTATSTTAATSTPDVVPAQQTGFIDAIVNNHDARILRDQYGTINFLWTFLDQKTLVITTNPDTLQEIILRLKNAPIISQPVAQ